MPSIIRVIEDDKKKVQVLSATIFHLESGLLYAVDIKTFIIRPFIFRSMFLRESACELSGSDLMDI